MALASIVTGVPVQYSVLVFQRDAWQVYGCSLHIQLTLQQQQQKKKTENNLDIRVVDKVNQVSSQYSGNNKTSLF